MIDPIHSDKWTGRGFEANDGHLAPSMVRKIRIFGLFFAGVSFGFGTSEALNGGEGLVLILTGLGVSLMIAPKLLGSDDAR